jgi:Type II CAAX prenyl endopeptidase Rce1-like
MSIQKHMSAAASRVELSSASGRLSPRQALAALEVLAVFAGILLYIWRWQYSHPYLWIPFLAIILLSHVVHHDTLRTLGLGRNELRSSASVIVPLGALVLLPAFVYGVASGAVVPALPDLRSIHYFVNYLLWSIFQQYLAQSFFHNRLRAVIQNRHLSSLLVALMFAAAHIPNDVLMAVTLAGGFALAEVFARHRNIWPLALVQAVAGSLVAALVPAAVIHNMRVGPGYFFYGRR